MLCQAAIDERGLFRAAGKRLLLELNLGIFLVDRLCDTHKIISRVCLAMAQVDVQIKDVQIKLVLERPVVDAFDPGSPQQHLVTRREPTGASAALVDCKLPPAGEYRLVSCGIGAR